MSLYIYPNKNPWVPPHKIFHYVTRPIMEILGGQLSTVRPRGTWPLGTRTSQIHGFDMDPNIFQLHGFPKVGHSFTLQLHGYELGTIIKKVTQFLSYMLFQNTFRQCNLGPYCINQNVYRGYSFNAVLF